MVNNRMIVSLFVVMLTVAMPVTVLATPDIQSWQTSNGAKVLFVEAPDLPMVDMRVVFDAGSARDGEIPGIAMLTNSMLTEGAGSWDADQIAERVESVGAELSIQALRDMSVISLRSLTEGKALTRAIETMAAVIARPTFQQQALDRNLQALKIVLRQEQQSPSEIASKAFFKAMYADHPYAHSSNGTEESIKLMTRDALVNFHKQFYVGRNAIIAIVGAVTKQQAAELAEKVIAGLPAGEHAPALPAVDLDQAVLRNEIAFPSSQAHLYIGLPVLSRMDPDYFPLYVGNHVLGGSGLVSRLSVEVRENRGLAYSSYSYFSPMRAPGPFMIGLQTKNSQAKQAEQVVLETLQNYMQKGPTAEELTRSKQNITGGFPLRLSSNKKIIEYLAMLGFYDLPLDYLDTFVDRVNAVTAEQIRDAFNRRVQTDKMSTIVVGQLAE
mgnify:CR=1 FL=1